MLYELREYVTVPGRMPALIKRFQEHTLRLFDKHGLRLSFITLTEFGDNSNNELVYCLEFDSYQQLQDRWASFLADPEWLAVKRDSERDGPLVASLRRRLLTTAPFDRE